METHWTDDPYSNPPVFQDNNGNSAKPITESSESSDVVVTNTAPKAFTFIKVWKDISGQNMSWPENAQITVTIHEDENVYATYTITNENLATGTIDANENGKQPLKVTQTDASGYVFMLRGLEEDHTYSVSEETVDGYEAPIYFNPDNSPAMGATEIGDKGKIENRLIAYELPSTGGPGTTSFTVLGTILIAGAGWLLWRRRNAM